MRSSVVVVAAVIAAGVVTRSQILPPSGAAEAWQKILKLRNPVSVMHITAHPDDEHGGVLAKLSRGDGARVTMLTLTRGESGDNAIGPELFDALGLIRTEELLVANRYYGVDQQYFATLADYGYSKSLEEAMTKWGRETVLREVVRIIRMERPTIILSRFQGTARDGHGNHQSAGLMAQEAFAAAGDPSRYADQIREGLRPWAARKIYIGGVRQDEDWTVGVETSQYDPVLGDSYEHIARRGLSFQRSQNSGRFTPTPGPTVTYYKLVGATAGSKEQSLFESLPKTIGEAVGASGRPIDEAIAKAQAAFRLEDPSTSAPLLAEGLKRTRDAMAAASDQARHVLRIKEQQFQDAINAAMGMKLTAIAHIAGAPVPGQTFQVETRLESRGKPTELSSVTIQADAGWGVGPGRDTGTFMVTAPAGELSTRPYFYRSSLHESRYTLRDPSQSGRSMSPPPLHAVGRYLIDGVPIELREIVKRRESKAPYGDVLREVRTVPRIAVNVSPSNAIVPFGSRQALDLEITLLHNADTASFGQVTLNLPDGWTARPGSQAFRFERPGEKASFRFAVRPGAIGARAYDIDAVAFDGLGEYREGYELIDHRDLEARYLYRPATAVVRGVNVTMVQGLKVGYVMGIGDQVPAGLQQLGAQVTLLGERDLASANLSQYDTIITGTRAYAVRDDLKTYNARLLDYVRNGGNMIVLYNTQELVPNTFAPYPGELPRTAEEVSEEDSPVAILAPQHQVFNWPNRISAEDFSGWVEQRGSKFFSRWDASYTPMIATNDRGQAPQSGGWLTARVGKGTWTYFAYALHRQLPYGVPGAYRITANLLALNKQPK